MSARILVQESCFDAGREMARLRESSGQAGALTVFVGTVREINEDSPVDELFLEHYPGMTEKQLASIVDEAFTRWDVIEVTVIHRVGALAPGDEIVFVGVAARHRGEAFDACEYIIDLLKTRATFWKKEKTGTGERWLETRESDRKVADAWSD